MTCIHEQTLRTPCAPSHIQLASDGVYVALPHGRFDVGIWSLQDITCKPLELTGHRKKVTATCFGHSRHPTLLCTGAEDYIIVWNVERARHCIDTGQQIRGQIIGTTLGAVTYLAFSYDDNKIAACIGYNVAILDTRQEKLIAMLEGHNGVVNCAEFCPHYSSTVVTAGDDRTFKIWDIAANSLIYQSTIISSSPFISLAMNPLQESCALGTTDGQVRVYDLTDGNGFRCLQHIDAERMQMKVKEARIKAKDLKQTLMSKTSGPVTISSQPAWQRSNSLNKSEEVDNEEDDSAVGCTILSLLYTYPADNSARVATPSHLPFLQRENTLVSDLLDNAPLLVIATTGSIFQLNAKTLEPLGHVSLQDPLKSSDMQEKTCKTITVAGNAALAQHPSSEMVWCLIGSAFVNEVNVLSVNCPTQEGASSLRSQLSPKPTASASGDEPTEDTPISVLSCGPLAANSPLKAELVLKGTDKTKKPAKSSTLRPTPTGQLNKKGQIVNQQPIVFHDKVRSSGYSKSQPKQTMFQPRTNLSKSGRASSLSSLSNGRASKASTPSKAAVKEYPMKSDPPTELKVKLDVAERPTAVGSLRFTSDGQHLACALANTTAQVFKMPLTGKGCAFASHKGVVSDVYWSNDSQWLLTSSDDRSAAVWSRGMPDPVMTLNTTNSNFGVDKEGGLKADKDNPLFTKGVRFAQFYYMDKFMLLTCGNTFYMYKYHLDTTKSDIKRYLTHNRFKLVKSFQMSESQQITAFSAVNSFYSYIVLCAGSNKSIDVFDLNEAKIVQTIPEVHTRHIHTIRQNEGSAYVSHPGSAYDLFVTASASDCIKLWDLRSNRCVRRYEGHINRTHPCGVAISPCSRYLATGSEDRSAYIFDIRSGTYLHKLTGHTDTVGDVAFHPLYPQLLTSTLDGKLRLFTT